MEPKTRRVFKSPSSYFLVAPAVVCNAIAIGTVVYCAVTARFAPLLYFVIPAFILLCLSVSWVVVTDSEVRIRNFLFTHRVARTDIVAVTVPENQWFRGKPANAWASLQLADGSRIAMTALAVEVPQTGIKLLSPGPIWDGCKELADLLGVEFRRV